MTGTRTSRPARIAALAAAAIWAVLAADAVAQDDAASDRAALEALYDATGGESWTNRTNWKTAAALGDWHGVTTDAGGRVTGLELQRNGLAGSIPPALGSLSRLESLDLGRNALRGPIPGALGRLVNLKLLILSRNDFTGPVPAAPGGLVNLELISLGSNALTGPIPDALASLAKLKELYLYDNEFDGPVPPWLANLTALETLVLAWNPLAGILPQLLTRLSQLTQLDITDTAACAPADDLFQAWLADIDFHGDTCNRAPEPVGAIPAQALTRSGPAIGVSVEAHFSDPDDDPLNYAATLSRAGTVTVLVSGDVVWLVPGTAGTATVTVTARDPDGLSATQTLAVTTAASDGLQGEREVLQALYDATGGAGWTDSTNWKTAAPLGEWHGVTTDNVGRVTALALRDNGLVGSLPLAVGDLPRLEKLDLGDNDLSGPIPDALGNLERLEELDLERNDLSGPIPDALALLSSLHGLDLSWNRLSGPVPVWLGSRLGLRWLYLLGNDLTGPIPDQLRHLVNLEGLALSWNDLSGGSVPTWLGNLTRLRWLYLSGIELTGPIPRELERLSDLDQLHLSWNELTGPVPAWLGGLYSLEELSLRGTALTGPVPGALVSLESLETLDLSYAWGLSGPLPPGLQRLPGLDDLDIFLNQTCAPADWQDWLATIEFRGRVCDAGSDATIDVAVVYNGGRARGGGRRGRDRGGGRPDDRRDQPGLRGERGPPPPRARGTLRGGVHGDRRLRRRSRPPGGPVGRSPGRGARPPRPCRGRPRAPDRRRRARRLRHSLSRRSLRPDPPGLRGTDLRARARAQSGAPARPLSGSRRRAQPAAGSGVRLREPACVRGGRRAVPSLAHDHVLQHPLRRHPCDLRAVAPFLESAPALRRRRVGRRLRRRRVGRDRSRRRGRGPRGHGSGGGAVAGSPRRRQPAAGGGGSPAGPEPDSARQAGPGPVDGVRRPRRRRAELRGVFVAA